MTARCVVNLVSNNRFAHEVFQRVASGARFAGLFASAQGGNTGLFAVLAHNGAVSVEQTVLLEGSREFPSLSSNIPSALWYEREIHDLFGLTPSGHNGVEPLVIAFASTSERPRLGSGFPSGAAQLDSSPLAAHLRGEGVFSMSYGPVRSGVFESVEYLVETPGEDIPFLRPRVSYKHRGIEEQFEGANVEGGVLVAERYEGVASVAHATAYCEAVEAISNLEIPRRAAVLRALHAELERIANHLDSTIRHTEAAGQAVAYARFSLHKERVQRLRGRLCGSRFSRGVVVPGGVSHAPLLGVDRVASAARGLQTAIDADMRLLMNTPSFLDRLRGTGVLATSLVSDFGALGPLARGSGVPDDVRWSRPSGAYSLLDPSPIETRSEGDALARQRVRVDEIEGSFRLIREFLVLLENEQGTGGPWSYRPEPSSGMSIGWAEAPQGEVLSFVEIDGGVLKRVKHRSASFHNLGLFASAFPRDILTDFAFIEASFGLSIAGVVG
jgi:Ni,Fe-hydrogenase III large subunit